MENRDYSASFRDSILDSLRARGVDLTGIEVDVVQFHDAQHQHCLWYGGQVAEVKYRGYLFSLEAKGNVLGTLLDETGYELADFKDRCNQGAFFTQMSGYLSDDKVLSEVLQDGRLTLENNNWFEIFIHMPDVGWMVNSYVCSDDFLGKCIVDTVLYAQEFVEKRELDWSISDEKCENNNTPSLVAALEFFGYDTDDFIRSGFVRKHIDEIVFAFENGVALIDLDFWMQYEELLDEKMTFEEYQFIDGLFDGDPLEYDPELDEDRELFVVLREELFGKRAEEKAKLEMAVECWEDLDKKYPKFRDEMSPEQEAMYVEDLFKLYEKEPFAGFFWCDGGDYAEYVGKPFKMVGRANAEAVDLASLPMWEIEFEGGIRFFAYAEEIIPSEMKNAGCKLFGVDEQKASLQCVLDSAGGGTYAVGMDKGQAGLGPER